MTSVTEDKVEDKAENKAKHWYVLQARVGLENQAKLLLQEHIDRSKYRDMFSDILVPTEEVVEMRDGKKRKGERKFFPGYVLIKMILNDETRYLVKSCPKIVGFVGGSGSEPAPISDAEADVILQQVEEGVGKPKPKVLFEPGEVVRVKDGPFTDFNGVVEEVNYEKNSLRVSVLIFGRSTPVKLEFGQVEKE